MKRVATTVWAVGALVSVAGWGIGNAVWAQDGPPRPPRGGGGFGGGPQQGGPGGFGGGPQGGGRQGRGGPGGGAFGTITAVDAGSGRITIRTQQGEGTQVVQLADGAQIVSQVTVTVADLKVDDQVQVQGVPTGITASSLTVGQLPDGFPGGPGGGPGGGLGGPPPGGGGGGFGGPGGGPPGAGGGPNGSPAFASATGKVTSTDPLTISLGRDVSLTLKLASNAKITRITTVDIASLKVGDRIVAMGQPNNDGAFAATSVGVNLEMGGMMGRGGRGGGRGPGGGGFGGPGGGGPGGGGGFGGPPRGGGGFDGPPPPPDGE